jgi:hypothetical protein
MAKSKTGPKRKVGLAAFLRRLWSKPDLMERFSQSREGRAQVIQEANLSARHAKLLMDGCVRDILVELAGATGLSENTTIIIDCDKNQADVSCGHPECQSFMATVVKEQQPLTKPKKPKKKR